MRFNDKINSFTDLNEHSYLRPPHVIVKEDDIDYNEIIAEADLYLAGKNRIVIYEDDAGNKFFLELTPYLHPVGAAAITLGTLATAASGVVTYTPTLEGRMLNEAGVQIPADEEASDVAGMLFTDYYYHFHDNWNQKEHHRATQIVEGDFLWLVRRGIVYLDATAAVTVNDLLMSSATVAGEVQTATAIDTAGTIAQYHATLVKNLLGDANPRYFALARALETIGGAGLVKADLLLPPRHLR